MATLVAVGTDIDGVAAGNSAYDFALDTARQRANKRAIRQLEAIGPPPHLEAKQFGTRVRWASNFGGVTRNETYGGVVRGLLASLLRSSDYSTGDVLRTVRGITATQAALLPELATLDLVRTLPRLDVPVVMVQGRLDQVAPGAAAERYASALEAPSKQLVWFENSAHTPHLEEPEKFREAPDASSRRSAHQHLICKQIQRRAKDPAPLRQGVVEMQENWMILRCGWLHGQPDRHACSRMRPPPRACRSRARRRSPRSPNASAYRTGFWTWMIQSPCRRLWAMWTWC